MSFLKRIYQCLISFFTSSFYYLSLFFIKQRRNNDREERIVAIVLSWKRLKNIPLVVWGLKKQSYIDDIIIFHNHPSWLKMPGCINIFSDLNLGCIIRHQIASVLETQNYRTARFTCSLASWMSQRLS